MKILNFGSCNIDYVYTVPHFVIAGETLGSKELNIFPGGKGLNQSIAIARSGVSVHHAGCVGDDGAFLRTLLKDNGVDVTFLRILHKGKTGHAIIQVDENGENSILLYGGANYEISENEAKTTLGIMGGGDILLLQNEVSNVNIMCDFAYERGYKIFLNPSPFEENLKHIDLNKIHTLVLNEVEAFEFTGEKEPEKIGKHFRERYKSLNILLTLGSEGSVYFGGDSTEGIYCPAFLVDTVDTTSAGDTFTGYFIGATVRGNTVPQALKIASAAAAVAVSRPGASSSIPTMAEVREFLKERE